MTFTSDKVRPLIFLWSTNIINFPLQNINIFLAKKLSSKIAYQTTNYNLIFSYDFGWNFKTKVTNSSDSVIYIIVTIFLFSFELFKLLFFQWTDLVLFWRQIENKRYLDDEKPLNKGQSVY